MTFPSYLWECQCRKTMSAILLILLLLGGLSSEVLGETAKAVAKPSELKPWLGFQVGLRIGISDLSGQPSRAFEDATTLEFVMGARVGKLSMEGFWQPTGASPTREFIRNSGYTKGFFDYLDHDALGLLFGLHLYDSYRLRVTPLAGVRWAWVRDGWFNLHPNWDLDSKSTAGLVGGLRLEFNHLKSDPSNTFKYLHWMYFQIIVADLSFDNPEYGDGTMVGLTIGYTIERLLGE